MKEKDSSQATKVSESIPNIAKRELVHSSFFLTNGIEAKFLSTHTGP